MTHSLFACHRRRCSQCRRPLQRYGKRRWHCPECQSTVRLSHRRRGRPPARGITLCETRLFLTGRKTVRDFRHATNRFTRAAHKRVVRGVRALGRSLRTARLPRNSPSPGNEFIAVADALWLWVRGERVTVYVILLRHLFEMVAMPAVVLPLRGWESEAGWRMAFDALPERLRSRLVSITADENGGLLSVARSLKEFPENHACQPLVQYCQFHRLADLQRKLGKKCIRTNRYAAHVWIIARKIFRLDDDFVREGLIGLFHDYVRFNPECPEHVLRAARAFTHDVVSACLAQEFWFLSIPATTGSAEATCKRLRSLFRKMRPTSLRKVQSACRLFRKLHPTITCNGKTNRIT